MKTKKTEKVGGKGITRELKLVNPKVENNSIVMPAVSPEEAVKAWKEYEELKAKIVNKKSDIQVLGQEEFLKKSYWRKLATFFNLTVEVVEEEKDTSMKTTDKQGNKVGNLVYNFTCKAIAPNGRSAVGTGSCEMYEKGYRNTVHNVRATAETRAYNRAVSNLVGGGEVSAEEVSQDVKQATVSNEATESQKKKIFALAKEAKMSADEIKELVKEKYKLDSFNDLSRAQANAVIDGLTKQG